MTRRFLIAAATLEETLLALGYTHAPSAGGSFSRGIYRDGKLVIRGPLEVVWYWLAFTGQVSQTPQIEAWMTRDVVSGRESPAEQVAAALEAARIEREAADAAEQGAAT